jgi:hypothetical protein
VLWAIKNKIQITIIKIGIMKNTTTILLILLFAISLTGCKSYREWVEAKKNGEITTQSKAYELFKQELDSILADQMSSYKTQSKFIVKNDGYFKVTNINEEQAPYIVGQIVSKTGNTVTQDQLPNLLKDVKLLDTKIKFDAPEVSMFINKSSSINVDALNAVKANISAEDKMKIVYNKVFIASPQRNWLDYKLWEQSITKYGLKETDSLWVVSNVQVKKFTYAIYDKIEGQFSATPTPVVAIEGSTFQESGGERNIYEVYIQLSRLRFPIEANQIAMATDSIINKGINTEVLSYEERLLESYLELHNNNEGEQINWIKK